MKWLIIKQTVNKLTNNQDVNNLIYVLYQKCIQYHIRLTLCIKIRHMTMDKLLILYIKHNYEGYCWLCCHFKDGIMFRTNTLYVTNFCYKCLYL